MTNNVEPFLRAKRSVEQLFSFYETQGVVETGCAIKLEILCALDELCEAVSLEEEGDV